LSTAPAAPDDAIGPLAWPEGPAVGAAGLASACLLCGVAPPRPGAAHRIAVTSPERAAEVVGPMVVHRDREACAAALLDVRHAVLAVELVSLGSLDHTFMAPREIYRIALRHNAAAVVVAHNHPSGDATPSDDDVAVTTRLARAGDLVGVQLLDHLVIAPGRWTSLARAGHV
jgi:DNA repair protein RadC